MHPDKYFAEIETQIANGTYRYSQQEASSAIHAHARAMRALEMGQFIATAARGLGMRLSAAAAAFAKPPKVAAH